METPEPSLPILPPELIDEVFRVLYGPDTEREKRLEQLYADYPEHAADIRAHAGHQADHQADPTAQAQINQQPYQETDGALEQVGPYRILRILGEGGMGTVYLGEQQEPIQRKVALKLIKPGMDSKAVISRFELERQALAVMNHDGIAKVLDAGMSERGQPYFVMEYVEGLPLTRYCDAHRLSLTDRIHLFQQVCAGVQHAHQKGVLHRDLKPSNILVARRGDQVVAKIIDFGIARATGQELIDVKTLTLDGMMLGTPEYMSPEQACANQAEIDTRTDVYSLGVILYELLTGALPHASNDLRNAGLMDVQRIIREVEPGKPSTKIPMIDGLSSTGAENRGLSATALRKVLRGDLDWIVMRAIAKEPARRYASATNLAQDLERYLNHDPVEAGPPSASYRLSKVVRKYRVQVVVSLFVVLALTAGVITALSFYVDAAEQEAIAKDRLNNFDRLAVAVKLKAAEKELQRLQPAWPDKSSSLEKWLKDEGEPLAEELPLVRETLIRLRERALPRTDTEERADRESHANYERYLKQVKRVASLQLAMDVRQGKRAAPELKLPSDAPTTAAALHRLARDRVQQDATKRVWGEEAHALVYARRALAIAVDEQHVYLNSLAWACFSLGLDAEAKKHSAAALATASLLSKFGMIGSQKQLTEAIEKAPATLAEAKVALEHLSSVLDRRRHWTFANQSDSFLHGTLLTIEKQLLRYRSKAGTLAQMRWLSDWSKKIDGLTRQHPNAQVTWAEAADAIALADDLVASELYSVKHHPDHAKRLQPQTGLVPLGMNPKTKLWEFYHLRSAWDPRSDLDPGSIEIPRHEADGSISVTGAMGIVFVLLPGGTYAMGSQKTDPADVNFDTEAEPDEVVQKKILAPFFLARHELTQGQWMRLSLQKNPSTYKGNGKQVRIFVGGRVTLAHPVEQVDWDMCTELLGAHGLQLPHEAQWEYGCRAGTSTPWSSGKLSSDLDGYSNLLDLTAKLRSGWAGEPVKFRDGREIHAPVGTYLPNAFGLHDVHGNVKEWCSNLFDSHSPERVTRSGSFNFEAHLARSSYRYNDAPGAISDNLGCRPQRPVY